MSITIFDATKPIEQLLPLNSSWSHNTNTAHPGIFTTLAVKQVPKILWLGCSDSRVPETSLLGLNPGEVFVHRNIANLINPSDTSFPAVLDYAVEHVLVTHIVLCGHIGCGGVATALMPPINNVAIDNWLLALKAISNRHSEMLNPLATADKQIALVKLSVQHGIKLLRMNNTVSETPGVVVHGAIYDINTGLLSFLEGNDEIEPPIFRTNATDMIRAGSFDTAEVWTTPQTNTTKAITFSTPYSKPPRIFLGLSSLDVNAHHDNPRMIATANNISTTGFQIHVDTWGSTIINGAKCAWLEIPDDDDYANFQTGTFSTSEDHPWNQWRLLTTRQVTFATPYATPPTVVMWLSGFDSPQDAAQKVNVFPSQITTTGFIINHEGTVYGQWSQWLAFPSDSKFGLSAGPFGVDSATSQTNTGTLTFNKLNLSAAAAPVIVGALNHVQFSGGDSMRASMVVQNPTGSSFDWAATTSGNASFTCCNGQYITVPSS